MALERIFPILNQMEAEGVIGRYAIGGAVRRFSGWSRSQPNTSMFCITTRVFTAEHLAAICLQVGRARDRDRIQRFIETVILDAETLDAILRRHGLLEQWRALEQSSPSA
jgi:hypothetical protein